VWRDAHGVTAASDVLDSGCRAHDGVERSLLVLLEHGIMRGPRPRSLPRKEPCR